MWFRKLLEYTTIFIFIIFLYFYLFLSTIIDNESEIKLVSN